MPLSVQAGLWGLLSGSALLLGAAVGWFAPLPRRLIAGIMAFGAGVLMSALSFELLDEAWKVGGYVAVGVGFLGGAVLFTGCNVYLTRRGAKHRKRAEPEKRHEHREASKNNAAALAVGALLDGIPEAIVIGVSMLKGGAVGMVAVVAVFLSNVPEGLSSAAGMKAEGKKLSFVLCLWSGIALVTGAAASFGYVSFAGSPPTAVAAVQSLAAGAILAMIVDTMVPEAFEGTHEFAGVIAVSGFLLAFWLSKAA